MFDLDQALRGWRQPFLNRHWYSRDQVAELEAHLMDAFEAQMGEGFTEEAAFETAVSRVGNEPGLRARFKSEWSLRNPMVKYWRLLAAESAALTDKRLRVGYRALRAYSFWVGGTSLIYLYAFFAFWSRGTSPISSGVSLEGQGMLFLLLWGMLFAFNFLPFREWTSSIGDWMRLCFGAVAFFFLVVFAYSGSGIANITDTVGIVVFAGSVACGPALWICQALARRDSSQRFRGAPIVQ